MGLKAAYGVWGGRYKPSGQVTVDSLQQNLWIFYGLILLATDDWKL